MIPTHNTVDGDIEYAIYLGVPCLRFRLSKFSPMYDLWGSRPDAVLWRREIVQHWDRPDWRLITDRFSICFPSDFKFAAYGEPSLIIAQAHSYGQYSSLWFMRMLEDGIRVVAPSVQDDGRVLNEWPVSKLPIQRDRWYRFAVESWRSPNPDGFVKVYVDGGLIGQKTNIRTREAADTNPRGSYFVLGPYMAPSWPASIDSYTLYARPDLEPAKQAA